MNAINAEKIKSFDVMQIRQPAGKKAQVNEGGAFKEAVMKVLSEKNESIVPEIKLPAGTELVAISEGLADAQLAVIVQMMAEANMTVLPYGMAEQVPVTENAGIRGPDTVPVNIGQEEQSVVLTEEPQTGAAEARAPETTAVNAPARENAPPQQEQVRQAGGTAKDAGGTVKGEQRETEKQTQLRTREVTVKAPEVKQDGPKETKHESAPQARAHIPVDPGKVYVKVGDGGTLAQEKFASDVSEKLAARIPAGTQQFVIELMPQDLGKILIKLVIQNGRAEIIMVCANPKTHQLVMANADTIRNLIEEKTGLATTVTTKEGTEAYSNLNQGNEQEKHGGNGEEKDGKWAEAETDIFLHHLRLGLANTAEAKT